jgi:WD40 repeat protein
MVVRRGTRAHQQEEGMIARIFRKFMIAPWKVILFLLSPSLLMAEELKVRPAQAMGLLKTQCLSCHNEEKRKGGLSLETRELALEGGENGPALMAGDAARSALITALSDPGDAHMPPKKQMPEKQINVLKAWVNAGAAWDEVALNHFGELTPADKLAELPAGHAPSAALALSPDGKWLAVGEGERVLIHDVGATDAPVIAKLEGHKDVVQSLAWSGDGQRLAAGGYRGVLVWKAGEWKLEHALAGPLEGRVAGITFLPDGVTLIVADGAMSQRGVLHRWKLGELKPSATVEAHKDNILSLALSRDGKQLATGGADGLAKVWDAATFTEVAKLEGHVGHVLSVAFHTDGKTLVSGSADKEVKVWDIASREMRMVLGNKTAGVTAVLWSPDATSLTYLCDNGSVHGVTELKSHDGVRLAFASGKDKKIASLQGVPNAAVMSGDGKRVFVATDAGVVLRLDEKQVVTPLPQVSAAPGAPAVPPKRALSFSGDVLPILSKAGCNLGSCHAKASGQAGFKLSVFAFDPRGDYLELVKDARGRRVFPALPEDSLLLQKATVRVEHEGGQRFEPDSEFAKTLADWIRQGMPYENPGQPALAGIEVTPSEKTYRKNEAAALKVTAKFSDGSVRDVTALADYSSSERSIADVDEAGHVKTNAESGETVVVARYLGHVAISRIAVPADKLLPPERYATLPVRNEIDKLVYARLQKLGHLPSETCSDGEFLRRSTLDAIGMLPTLEEARAFAADKDPGKYDRWVDGLLQRPEWADHWAIKWGDLLRPNPSRVGVKPVYLLDQWIRQSFRENKPWDRFVSELLTAQGNTHQYGPVAIWRDKREPVDAATFIGQIFLGIRLECAKCHHHPSEKWDMTDYYQMAAFFTQMKRKGQGISAPISGEPERWWFAPGSAGIEHPVTKATLKPRPPAAAEIPIAETQDPRAVLADWMTDPKNPHFARALVNRVWSQFLGRGIVDPVDDFRASNPPTNGPLLDWLAQDFVAHGYDLKHLMRTIMLSQVYRLSSLPNETNLADLRNYSRSYRRRLPAETLLDAVCAVTETREVFTGMPPESLAKQTWNQKLESQFMDAFGRPNASAECPCERDAKPSVVQALHMMNSTKLQALLMDGRGRVERLAKSDLKPEQIIEELYLVSYARPPTAEEQQIAMTAFQAGDATRKTAIEDILWSLLNSAEFVFNH